MSGLQLRLRVQTYLDAVVQTCAQVGHSMVSMPVRQCGERRLLGCLRRGPNHVLPDAATRENKRRLREEVERLETFYGFRRATAHSSGVVQARIERAVGHLFPCCVCTRGDLISGDVARVLDLRPWEASFVDRIAFASIVASPVTVWGEDLLPRVPVASVRRLDVLKALFAFSCQVLLSVVAFPALPDATKPSWP